VRRLLIAAAVLLAGSAHAQVDPKIKAECMKAVDFQGCVKVLSGRETSSPPLNVQVDINKINSTGNMCPSGWAYIGGGYCLEVSCGFVGYHDQRIAGKGWSCKGLGWFNKDLVLGSNPVRATYNSQCPDQEPDIGHTSSCTKGSNE